MAARFPQSATPVAYQISAAWASKIKAIYWPADENTLHRLRPGETVTTLVTRSATGVTFNATDGRIAGTPSELFTDEIPGGFDGIQENSNFCFGGAFWGDAFYGVSNVRAIASRLPPDTNQNGFAFGMNKYGVQAHVHGGPIIGSSGGMADDIVGMCSVAVRHNQADAIADLRAWINGVEDVSWRITVNPVSTEVIGSIGQPVYLGGSVAPSTGNTQGEFECAWIATVLTDLEMEDMSTNPADILEVATGATITLTPDPASVQVGSTRTFTATRSAPAGAGGVTYNVASDNPAVATVPTPQSLTEADSDLTFDATGVSVGTANITITNAANSSETDTVALTVTAVTTKKAKFLVHPDFASATGITIEVNEAPTGGALTGAKLGFATGIAAESTLEAGQAVIKVDAADVDASALAAATNVVGIFKGTTSASSPLGNAVEAGSVVVATGTIIEE